MYEKYIKIEELDSKYRYEYEELDIGDLFLSDNELYIRTEEGALSLKNYKTVQFAKGSYVVKPCEVTEMNEADYFDKEK